MTVYLKEIVAGDDYVRDYNIELDGGPAHRASLQWAEFHGIDVSRVLDGSIIIRDAERHQIFIDKYIQFDEQGGYLLDADKRIVTAAHTEQGEAGPAPLPPEVLAIRQEALHG